MTSHDVNRLAVVPSQIGPLVRWRIQPLRNMNTLVLQHHLLGQWPPQTLQSVSEILLPSKVKNWLLCENDKDWNHFWVFRWTKKTPQNIARESASCIIRG